MRRATGGEEFRHAGLAMMAARKFYIDGSDLDDLYQSACEAIVRAMPLFDASKGRESTFAYRCAFNELLRLVREAATQKRSSPGEVLSLYGAEHTYDDHVTTLLETLEAVNSDPALIVEQRDELHRALGHPSLTVAERACLIAAAVGADASEVGWSHSVSTTARQKIRRAA